MKKCMETSSEAYECYKTPDCEQGDASGGNPGPIPRDVDIEGGVNEATVVVTRATNDEREYMIDILCYVDIHVNMWNDINWEEDLHDTEPITLQEVTERASRYCLFVRSIESERRYQDARIRRNFKLSDKAR